MCGPGSSHFTGRCCAFHQSANVASRLCDEAKPGQILISPRVLMAVEDAVTVEPVGECALKGIRRPLAAYNVLAASSQRRPPARRTRTYARACVIGAAGGLILLATGVSGAGGIVGLALPLFIVLSLLTVVASNAISGALSVFPNRAGAAAALAGAIQFGAGAIASAAVGWSADGTPRPMSVLICAGAVAALVANLVLIRSTD